MTVVAGTAAAVVVVVVVTAVPCCCWTSSSHGLKLSARLADTILLQIAAQDPELLHVVASPQRHSCHITR